MMLHPRVYHHTHLCVSEYYATPQVLHHLHAPSKWARAKPLPAAAAHPSGGTPEPALSPPQQAAAAAAAARLEDEAADEQPPESGFIPEEQLAEVHIIDFPMLTLV